MKRYRVLHWDFDTRARTLLDPIREEWDEEVKKLHYENRARTERSLIAQYGEIRVEQKRKNFIDLEAKTFSIVAFHNKFFEQVRTSFVMGAYYPALTAACALGERILNHLILVLRNDYRSTPEYKKIYRKDSFDDWVLAIETLVAWDILLPEVKDQFYELMEMRHKAIHFRPETDRNDRELALEAIRCLQRIIGTQFSGFGPQPWFITGIPGEIYIKKEWENRPFIKKVYLPNCAYVGPRHIIESLVPQIVVNDRFEYEDKEVPDEEFVWLRLEAKRPSKADAPG
jgi:thiamine pyrophosphokinase